ncbi:MAG TPA: FAD-dependent oxidoreductase [Egibacteraceae bacterium]|nr:FAD-dependent oxidoreductase [Egibacteraceae bacterium]
MAPRLVVIGGDAAGMSAASHVNRVVPEAEVIVVERGPHTSYSMCGIPFLVGGVVGEGRDLVVRSPEQFRRAGVTVHTRTEAISVDADARRVRVRDLAAGAERDEPYDLLLVATGARPVVPPVPGAQRYAEVVHTLAEGERLRARLDAMEGDARTVVVVGAGYIGLELAEALVTRGLDATLVDANSQVMASLDADMARPVEEALRRFGVHLALAERLEEVRGEGRACREVVTDGGAYDADLVVVAVGARPAVDVARTAGCAVGDSGALLVDPTMRTSVEGIWAAGDCVESTHLVSGAPVNVQLGTHANKQGRIAGLHLAAALRGDEPPAGAAFPGVVGTAVTKICDTEVARTGLNEREARDAGVGYAAVRFTGSARAGYLPDAGEVAVKMLAERGTGRVLGAQLVGTGNVGKRIDTAATWCQLGVRVQQAQLLDLAYAPPFGGVWDLLAVGARKLVRELGLSPQL